MLALIRAAECIFQNGNGEKSSKKDTSTPANNRVWLGRLDSNQGMAESKSAALPLGYAPKPAGALDIPATPPASKCGL
jgi:hypothetical protein